VVQDPDGRVLASIAEGIGIATNNVAEYTAALEGLRRAADLRARSALVRADSKLLIEQLSGRWRVKNPTLIRLHGEVRAVLRRFPGGVTFEHVPRELNREADKLANRGVDQWLAGPGKGYRPPGPAPDLLGEGSTWG
jgi:ribonuclease HI